jgi:hypothetical protein
MIGPQQARVRAGKIRAGKIRAGKIRAGKSPGRQESGGGEMKNTPTAGMLSEGISRIPDWGAFEER